MNWVYLVIVGVLFLLFVSVAALYFRTRSRGKSHLAVSASASIAAIATAYFSLLSVNWPTAAIAWLVDPAKVLEATQPSWITVVGGMPVALAISWILYRLALAELGRNRLPINASAAELEEPGRIPGVFELAAAHLRYLFQGKPDRVLTNPGEDPYHLPKLEGQIEWAHLAADLLVQREPNLIRDSFRYVKEKKFFKLTESEAFDETKERLWIVYPAPEGSQDIQIAGLVYTVFPITSREVPEGSVFVVCVKSDSPRDESILTPDGRSLRVLSQATLIQESLDFSEYASSLIRRFERRPIPGAEYTLKDCFVPPKVREAGAIASGMSPSSDEEDLLSVVKAWADQPGVDHISIVGEFGQGKSTAVLAYCAQWARLWVAGDRAGRIPLLIELRGKSPRRQAQDRFLAEWGDRYGLRGGALLSLVQTGRVTLIFEGFDEVQDAGLRFDRFEQFKALWSFSYPGVKIIFTGRPNFFLDTNERARLLRDSPTARDAGLENSRVLELSFLDIDGISSALGKYPLKVRNEILDQCERDPAFFQIAKRPSMLPVIGNQWTQISAELASQGGITSANVIKYFIDFLYSRKEADQERLGEFQLLHRDVRHYFTQRVAWRMVQRRLRNTIDKEQFALAIEEAYPKLDAEFRMDVAADPKIASSIAKLKEAFKDRPHSEIIAAIATDVRTSGLFTLDPAGGRDNVYFPHKQYYEFIIGEIFFKNLTEANPMAWAPQISRSDMGTALQFEPVSIFFASGLLTTEQRNAQLKQSLLSSFSNVVPNWGVTLDAVIVHTALDVFGPVRPNLIRMLIWRKVALRCPFSCRRFSARRCNTCMFTSMLAYLLAASALMLPNLIELTLSGLSSMLFLYKSIPFQVLSTVFLAAFFLPFLFFFLESLLFKRAFGRRAQVDLDEFMVLMEIYRQGSVKSVLQAHGQKANAALILWAARDLPLGAIPIPPAIILDAIQTLDIKQLGEDIFAR